MDVNMSVNSSSSSQRSFLPPHLNSANSSYEPLFKCSNSSVSRTVFSALSIAHLFLLPLPILVLYLGFQQWRRQRSTSTFATSNSDVFSYHSVTMQLSEMMGLAFFFWGIHKDLSNTMFAGICICIITSTGKDLFHLLTCADRYLAVCHPIRYRQLRQASGVRIRNISIGCVWVFSFVILALMYGSGHEANLILYYSLMGFFLILISYFSTSVLCALKRPGPGEAGGNRDQTKQRAFYTIMAIMAVLLLSFGGTLVVNALYTSSVFTDMCMVLMSAIWFDLPSKSVVPLLFLHRAGKFQCCKQNTG